MGSIEPDVQEARIGRSQPGVGMWSPHFFVLHFFESGLSLNPHNKRNSFGLFISLYLCCVVDCINFFLPPYKPYTKTVQTTMFSAQRSMHTITEHTTMNMTTKNAVATLSFAYETI